MSSSLLDLQQPESSSSVKPPNGISQQGWEEQGACTGTDVQDSCEDSSPLLMDRLHSLAEAEKLFDELTQEKLQVRHAHSEGHSHIAHHITHSMVFTCQPRHFHQLSTGNLLKGLCVVQFIQPCISDTPA